MFDVAIINYEMGNLRSILSACEAVGLKTIITDMEDEVLANSGVDVFEEVFKLIFSKLYDESKSKDDRIFIDRIINRQKETLELNDLEKIGKKLYSCLLLNFKAL